MDADSESSKEEDTEVSAVEEETDDENDKRRKEALKKLENASEESFLSQVGLVNIIIRHTHTHTQIKSYLTFSIFPTLLLSLNMT